MAEVVMKLVEQKATTAVTVEATKPTAQSIKAGATRAATEGTTTVVMVVAMNATKPRA